MQRPAPAVPPQHIITRQAPSFVDSWLNCFQKRAPEAPGTGGLGGQEARTVLWALLLPSLTWGCAGHMGAARALPWGSLVLFHSEQGSSYRAWLTPNCSHERGLALHGGRAEAVSLARAEPGMAACRCPHRF